MFRQAAEVGLVGPGYIWIIPSLAVGNPNSPPPAAFPVGVIGVIGDQWRKSLRQRVREGVAIVAKGADGFKRQYGFIPEGHGDCGKPATPSDNNTLFRWASGSVQNPQNRGASLALITDASALTDNGNR